LIYEIVRRFDSPETPLRILGCMFSRRIASIIVQIAGKNWPLDIREIKLNPETSTQKPLELLVPLNLDYEKHL
jgi:hypothetical protein